MAYTIDTPKADQPLLEEIARLWNANAAGRHAYFPWTGPRLARQLFDHHDRPVGRFAVARTDNGELAGFIHFSQVLEDGYPNAGVIEAVLVDSAHRKQGVGARLLGTALGGIHEFRPAPTFVDALGAWPFGFGFNTLMDGSERSGIFLSEPAVYRLFRRAGFVPVRQSYVMRMEIAAAKPRPVPRGCGFYIDRRTENTWLDRVFRGRELWDHDFACSDGRVLSRCIFGFMDGESKQEGRSIFSLFGVNTPRDQQGKGYASINITHLMEYLQTQGGEILELHVYADNTPALALYQSLGFHQISETVMMHRRLP